MLKAVRPHSQGEASQLVEEGGDLALLGMDEEIYHARPEISASGMKVLLRSPKAFLHSKSVPAKPKAAFDVGHAVHTRVLGVGMPVVMIPPDKLSKDGGIRSNDAKDWVEKARRDGNTPLKPADYDLVVRGSDAVLTHPKAGPLLKAGGVSEVSLFGTDPETGIRIRSRLDRLSGLSCLDVKTTPSLATRKLQMVVDDFGYDLQAEVYRFMLELLTGHVADPMTLIFMEKEPPYDVRPVRLDQDEWIEGGWQKFRKALELFARCVESGVWPGVDDEEGPIASLVPPPWYASRVHAGELEVMEEED